MTAEWWSSRIGLSLLWTVVVQVVADWTGDLLPWWVAVLLGLLAGFLGTFVIVAGWHAVTGSDS